MIHPYQGHYNYNNATVGGWGSTATGVYYCGYIGQTDKKLYPLYIGKGTGEKGMRDRLLAHLREERWPDVTAFGFCMCDAAKEADEFEIQEIRRCRPKYNIQHT